MKNQIVLPATRGCAEAAVDFVGTLLEAYGCSPKAQIQLSVAVEEIFLNIASYAYKNEDGEVLLCVEKQGENVVVSFSDSGIAFNPLKRPDPNISLSAEEREIGGLGIFMVKKTMDHVEYARTDGKNILTLTKKL